MIQPTAPVPSAAQADQLSRGVTVLVPVYNEAGAISETIHELTKLLATLTGWKSEIIAIDDGSKDGSADVLRTLPCETVQHQVNLGYGAALKTGIRHARYANILICDADGTYPITAIPDLLETYEGCDMAVGSRTGKVVQVPLIRRPGKWIITRLAEFLSRRKIPDLNSGLRVFKKEHAEKFSCLLPEGFSFTTTITLALMTNGYSVRFMPIDYHRRVGTSSIRPIRDFTNFFILIIRISAYFKPLHVFVPPALVLILLGIVKGFIDYFGILDPAAAGHLGILALILTMTGVQMLFIALLADLIDHRMKL